MNNTATLPNFSTYGNYSSSNYGANALVFEVGDLRVWFSYKTPVAFQKGWQSIVVRENAWGPTTGKHLNWIDRGDKKSRIPGERFEEMLAAAMNGTP